MWFEISIADRRDCFLTTHPNTYEYVELTHEHYEILSRIKRAQPEKWNTIGKINAKINQEGGSVSPTRFAVTNDKTK